MVPGARGPRKTAGLAAAPAATYLLRVRAFKPDLPAGASGPAKLGAPVGEGGTTERNGIVSMMPIPTYRTMWSKSGALV